MDYSNTNIIRKEVGEHISHLKDCPSPETGECTTENGHKAAGGRYFADKNYHPVSIKHA